MVEGERPRDFPRPAEGITAEVFSEQEINKDQFTLKTLSLMEDENMPLKNLVIFAKQRVLKSIEFQDWTLAYYAILSRSAKKQGVPMIEVTQSVIDKIGVEKHLRGDSARARGVNELTYLAESMDNINNFAIKDRAISEELGKYWDRFFTFLADMAESNPMNRFPSIHLGIAVFDFAETIRIQHRIDKGEQPFPQQN